MTSTPDLNHGRHHDEDLSALRATLPLLALTGLLIVAAAVIYLYRPRFGPDDFPIWGLFLTLGFVAAIGSVVSWFWAVDDRETAAVASTNAYRAPSPSREEFGRPTPDFASRGKVARPSGGPDRAGASPSPALANPWDEDVLPPVAAHGPRPVWTTPDDPGDIARALEEIAEIQRQLTTRPRSRPASVAEPLARA